jgi:putative heme-binding domain-containing protein
MNPYHLPIFKCCILAHLLINFTLHGAVTSNFQSLSPLIHLLNQSEDTPLQLDVLRGISQALQGRSQVAMPSGWVSVESRLGRSPTAEVRTLIRSLSLTFGSQKARSMLHAVLVDTKGGIPERLNALKALVQARDTQLPSILLDLVRDKTLRSEIIPYLARYHEPGIPKALLELYATLSTSDRQSALSVLASRVDYALSFLEAVEEGLVPRRDLSAALVRELRNLNYPRIHDKLEEIWGSFREISADKQVQIDAYKRIYFAGGSTPGNAMEGRAVFVRACQQCHVLFGTGGAVGPDITGSDRSNLDYLLQNIVDPNAVIPHDYRSTEIETTDGRVITGIVKERQGDALKVTTATETMLVANDTIESEHQGELSMMPEDLLLPFTDQEIRDLLYYLRQPAQAPLPASKDTRDLFFNGRDLNGWVGDPLVWSVENGEIVGETTIGLKHNAFLVNEMVFRNFRLILEVKLSPDGENSGIQFRSQHAEHGEVKGYQADIGEGWWGKLYEELGRGLLWDKTADQHVRKGEWNQYEILAVNHQIQTAVNGVQCVDLKDPEGALQGFIAFQVHSGGPVQVRFRRFDLEIDPDANLKTVEE